MSSFDARARLWDMNTMHTERSVAIAGAILQNVPIRASWRALEFGAGTGILSFLLQEKLTHLTLIDNSQEMVNVCLEKCQLHDLPHINPIFFDLEHNDMPDKFDFVFSQMALHHVKDVEAMLLKLSNLLNPGGFLAIADLYSEDGSFHGPQIDVHHGFNPDTLSKQLSTTGLRDTNHVSCYNLTRETGVTYPIFLLVAQK